MMNSINSGVDIERTTILSLDTETESGVSNIPFVVARANATPMTSMTSTFGISELTEKTRPATRGYVCNIYRVSLVSDIIPHVKSRNP